MRSSSNISIVVQYQLLVLKCLEKYEIKKVNEQPKALQREEDSDQHAAKTLVCQQRNIPIVGLMAKALSLSSV